MTPAAPAVHRLDPDRRVTDALDGGAVPHRVVRHTELGDPVRSALDVARLLDIDPDRIAKTLVVTSQPRRDRFALVVLPVLLRVDFRRVSEHLGWNRATLASAAELAGRIGQPVDGVSPLGDHGLPVVIDTAMRSRPSVLVGAGTPGVEIEIAPRALMATTGACSASIAHR